MDRLSPNATVANEKTANAEGGSTAPPFLHSLFSLAHDMSAVQRFSRLRMVHPENVLAHTGMVCVFAYAITSKLIEAGKRQLNPLSMATVMERAVAHDMDETITGDIVRPTKYFSGALREELGRLENKGIANIAAALDLPLLMPTFQFAKYGREGYVVKLADMLSALCTVYIEVCVLGNCAMVQAAQGMRKGLDDLCYEPERWNTAELKIIDAILDEAKLLLAIVTSHTNPLPSLHEER